MSESVKIVSSLKSSDGNAFTVVFSSGETLEFTSDEALEYGIISQVLPDEELEAATQKLAERLAAGPSEALAGSKALLNRAAYPQFNEQLIAEAVQVGKCAASDDFITGIRSILERKPPVFD